jgi:hypothetical protein
MRASQEFTKLALTYDNTASFDGTGAQIQRILAIFAICRRYDIPYIHSGIKELIITPLDPFQTESELLEYLKRVNNYFELPSDFELGNAREVSKLQTLSNFKLLEMRVANKLHFGKKELVAIANPFQVLNRIPELYTLAAKNLQHKSSASATKRIILHYRRGSNTLDILPGESEPRGLPNEWYTKTLRKYVTNYQELGIDFRVEVYTDMPKSSFTYTPKEFQSHLWSHEPRFKNGAVEVFGEDIKNTVFAEFGDKLIVHHGGDPLQGLIDMSEADILITSRSSYSYVGGLLNLKGKIIIPSGFWHSKLNSWVLEP